MLVNKIGKFKQVKGVTNPKYIVFCDFDETYYPHELNLDKQKKLYELEDYLVNKANQQDLVFGWVTGSSIESVLNKMEKGNLRFLPHFIASNLGTEIAYFFKGSFNVADTSWDLHLTKTTFSSGKVEKIIKTLKSQYQIILEPQTQLGSSRFKKNFYYKEQNQAVDEFSLSVIEQLAKKEGISVNINKCNPFAGDPADSYDVDFIPSETGKNKIVEFMLHKYGVDFNHSFAFGDSGNDLQMLKSVKHGYLVGNATNEAKAKHSATSIGEYSDGILTTLKSIIQE
ncbi:HAD-IIB family hydrolase [Priestia megaterium]|nr:HAD-IIB family hydrolase [Priestia megaterium]